MTVPHRNLSGSALHETKGVGTASTGQVHVCTGAATSGWQKLTASNLDNTSIKNTNLVTLSTYLPDVSAPSTAFVVSPFAGNIIAVYSALGGAITLADSNLAVKLGATTMTNGTFVVSFTGSAAGDMDSCLPTGANTVTAGQVISVVSDGASTTTQPLWLTLVLQLT